MRNEAVRRLEALRERGISDTEILEYILYHYLSGDASCETLEAFAHYECDFSFEEEEETEEETEEEEED
jgi:hypothetical protein